VSAVVASPTLGVESPDPVRALQHALYRAAKADPGRRFHALYDKVHRRDVLARAWWCRATLWMTHVDTQRRHCW